MKSQSSNSSCLEITILWTDTVLAVREVEQGKSFWIGTGTQGAPCDFVVPVEALGLDSLQLVVGGETPTVQVPRGARGRLSRAGEHVLLEPKGTEEFATIALEFGEKLEVCFGSLIAVINKQEREARFGAEVRSGRAWKHNLYIAGSAVLHLGALAAAMFFCPSQYLTDNETVSRDQLWLMKQYLEASAEREMEAQEQLQEHQQVADNREGGTGTRAKGEEGSLGANVRDTNKRYGVAGPKDALVPIARSEALRQAAEFGMIGLLNGGAGGDPNAPQAGWGRDDSFGTDPISARGNLWGDSIGESFGAGGLGLGGIGTGGGGRGAATGSGFGSGRGRLGAPGVPGAPAPVTVPPVPNGTILAPERTASQEVPIDPNGRFATTYRPGHGHLAAFESAVARGILPPAARELVSDIGASYAPQIPPPTDRALAYQARLERSALPPSGGSTHFRLALRSTPQLPSGRPHLSVHLVLDVSGSMEGDSIVRAKEAANRLVDKLAPTDDFSLVTFSTSAEVRVRDEAVGPNRRAIHSAINELRADGGTNIEAGLRMGYAEASKKTIPEDAVRVVLLLSDGRANAGLTYRPSLAAIALNAFQGGIQTSTFGLGTDYDGELMSAIASDGAGAYYYLRDGSQIGAALATEVDKRLDPAATAVEVRVRLREGIQLLRVYGSKRLGEEESARVRVAEVAADQQAEKRNAIKRDRQEDRQGGMRFFIPAFARDDAWALLLKVAAPAGTGQRDAGLVELRYKDRLSSRNVYEEIPIRVSYANSDAESASTADGSVSRTVQGFLAGESLLAAAASIERGNRVAAATLLGEREAILREAAGVLQEPAFRTDADRIARLRSQVEGRGDVGEPRALAMLLETAARSHLH